MMSLKRKNNTSMMDLFEEELEGEDICSLHSEITIKEELTTNDSMLEPTASMSQSKKQKLQRNRKSTSKLVDHRNSQTRITYATRGGVQANSKKQTVQPDNHKKIENHESVGELFHGLMCAKQQINVDINNTDKDKDENNQEIKDKPSNLESIEYDSDISKGKVFTESRELESVKTVAMKEFPLPIESVDDKTNSSNILDDCNQESDSKVDDDDFIDDNEDNLDYRILDAEKEVPTYECNDCDMKSTTLSYFRNHLKEEHDKDMPVYECKYCNKKLAFKKKLKAHILKEHKDSVDVSECTLCDHITIYKYNLKMHALAVHKDNILQCDLCDFWTYQKHELGSHSKSFHESRKTCQECGLIALSDEVLKHHIKEEHEKQIRFSCTQCSFFSNLEYNLKNHIQSVHEKKRFQCTECTYYSGSKAGLSGHRRAKHSADNGLSMALEAAKEAQKTTFNCSDCEYTSTRKDLLKKHTLRAHVLKNTFFQCPDCNTSVKNQYSLKQHRIRMHGVTLN